MHPITGGHEENITHLHLKEVSSTGIESPSNSVRFPHSFLTSKISPVTLLQSPSKHRHPLTHVPKLHVIRYIGLDGIGYCFLDGETEPGEVIRVDGISVGSVREVRERWTMRWDWTLTLGFRSVICH